MLDSGFRRENSYARKLLNIVFVSGSKTVFILINRYSNSVVSGVVGQLFQIA